MNIGSHQSSYNAIGWQTTTELNRPRLVKILITHAFDLGKQWARRWCQTLSSSSPPYQCDSLKMTEPLLMHWEIMSSIREIAKHLGRKWLNPYQIMAHRRCHKEEEKLRKSALDLDCMSIQIFLRR